MVDSVPIYASLVPDLEERSEDMFPRLSPTQVGKLARLGPERTVGAEELL